MCCVDPWGLGILLFFLGMLQSLLTIFTGVQDTAFFHKQLGGGEGKVLVLDMSTDWARQQLCSCFGPGPGLKSELSHFLPWARIAYWVGEGAHALEDMEEMEGRGECAVCPPPTSSHPSPQVPPYPSLLLVLWSLQS